MSRESLENSIARIEKDIERHLENNDGSIKWVDELHEMLMEVDRLRAELVGVK